MIHPETHLVTKSNGPRPAGAPDRCFYCQQPLGQHHSADCPCRVKTVMVRAAVEYAIEVPESFSAEDIELSRNKAEGSWCADNMLPELERAFAKTCGCDSVEFQVLGDATKEQEERYGLSALVEPAEQA